MSWYDVYPVLMADPTPEQLAELDRRFPTVALLNSDDESHERFLDYGLRSMLAFSHYRKIGVSTSKLAMSAIRNDRINQLQQLAIENKNDLLLLAISYDALECLKYLLSVGAFIDGQVAMYGKCRDYLLGTSPAKVLEEDEDFYFGLFD
jgi:hypothetical protein